MAESLEQKPATSWEEFNEWMHRELPSGTIIGSPGWWASRIYKRFISAPIPATCPVCTQAIDDAAKAGRIVDERDDYKARALLYERTNAEQAKLLNEVIAERDGLMGALSELVALKDLKDRLVTADLCTYNTDDAEAAQALDDDYSRRKPLAWEAARAAIAKVQP